MATKTPPPADDTTASFDATVESVLLSEPSSFRVRSAALIAAASLASGANISTGDVIEIARHFEAYLEDPEIDDSEIDDSEIEAGE